MHGPLNKKTGIIAATATLAHEDGALTCSASAHEHGLACGLATTSARSGLNTQ